MEADAGGCDARTACPLVLPLGRAAVEYSGGRAAEDAWAKLVGTLRTAFLYSVHMYSISGDTSVTSITSMLDVGCTHPAVATYEPRDPSQTVLYSVVADHLETFLASLDADPDARGLPAYVQRELYDYLQCGILAHGFLRLGCDTCHQELLLAFSCKRRGFCPSCAGRRMAQTAAHLVEQVIPWVPTRQWVVSVPVPLRYWMAASQELTATGPYDSWFRRLFSVLRKPARQKHHRAAEGTTRVSDVYYSMFLSCWLDDRLLRRRRCPSSSKPAYSSATAPRDAGADDAGEGSEVAAADLGRAAPGSPRRHPLSTRAASSRPHRRRDGAAEAWLMQPVLAEALAVERGRLAVLLGGRLQLQIRAH